MVRIASYVLVLIGGVGFFFPALVALGALEIADSIETPNAHVANAEISTSNEIFIASPVFGRIQKYSKDGNFIRGWRVNARGGGFCAKIIGSIIHVNIARRDAIDEYDFDGRFLKSTSRRAQKVDNSICNTISKVAFRWDGVHIVVADQGQQEIIIRRKPWHYLMISPFQSWIIFMFGLFLNRRWRLGVWRRIRR